MLHPRNVVIWITWFMRILFCAEALKFEILFISAVRMGTSSTENIIVFIYCYPTPNATCWFIINSQTPPPPPRQRGIGRLTDFQLRRKSPCFNLGADTHHKNIHIKDMSWKLTNIWSLNLTYICFVLFLGNYQATNNWRPSLFETKIVWGFKAKKKCCKIEF